MSEQCEREYAEKLADIRLILKKANGRIVALSQAGSSESLLLDAIILLTDLVEELTEQN